MKRWGSNVNTYDTRDWAELASFEINYTPGMTPKKCAEIIRRCHANRALPQPPQSDNLLEIAALGMDPPMWAALQIIKAGRPTMTQGEAIDLIVATVRKAIETDREQARLGICPTQTTFQET